MVDSLEKVCTEIAAAVGPQLGAALTNRVIALVRGLEAKHATEIDVWHKIHQKAEENERKATARSKVLTAEVRSLRAKIERLQRDLAKKNQMVFGSKADRQKREAPTEAEEQITQVPASASDRASAATKRPANDPTRAQEKSKKSRKIARRGPKDYGDLPRVEEIMSEGLCDCGGGTLGYDIREELIAVPAHYYILVRKYPRHRCLKENRIIGTPFKPAIFPGGEMTHSVLAYTMVGKFDWASPYYRQERIARQSGVNIQRSTLSRNVNKVTSEALAPIYDILERHILDESAVLHMDASVIYRQINGRGKVAHRDLVAIARDGHGYGETLPRAVIYYVYPSLTQKVVAELLGGRQLTVQHDGAAVFNELGQAGTSLAAIISTECWAHCRRYFVDEYNYNKTAHADHLIELIARMYRIEEQIRGSSPRQRKRVRRRLTTPIMAEIHRRLHDYRPHHLEKGGMGKAISYALRRWTGLTRFLDDGRIELDNNNVERLFKAPIIARKNSLFIGSDLGERAWAILFSLIQTCLMNSVDPYRYLLWVLDEIARKKPRSEYAELLPWNAPESCHVKRKLPKAKRIILA
ncbi:IS66 family transposase [Paracoccus aerodenitrificans]|uniref:IS66 family transposase n=1 Tax=Paracoccus aerodenitrificans TaxID=3017781 RepID=UPI0022F0FB8A|nr:IS66 family transposase [Paracoccus aerodenitrificans]WBU63587.1 IS66 family transposase [Paracoccus aerodenitrificans]